MTDTRMPEEDAVPDAPIQVTGVEDFTRSPIGNFALTRNYIFEIATPGAKKGEDVVSFLKVQAPSVTAAVGAVMSQNVTATVTAIYGLI